MKLKKLTALFLTICLILSLVACAAPGMEPDEGGFDGPDGPVGNLPGQNAATGAAPEDSSGSPHPSFAENPFIATAENNVSTFSADVDTASYSYFRKLVNNGYTLS